MIHPSYVELMEVVNEDVVIGEEPVVNSRYSIVLATAKRARQIIAHQSREGQEVNTVSKPLSKAVAELYEGKIKVLPEDAERLGVVDKQIVSVKINSPERKTIFGDVLVRVTPTSALAMHIDTDESNACGGANVGEIVR